MLVMLSFLTVLLNIVCSYIVSVTLTMFMVSSFKSKLDMHKGNLIPSAAAIDRHRSLKLVSVHLGFSLENPRYTHLASFVCHLMGEWTIFS